VKAIEIVLVDRATMTKVHADFFSDPTDTDVITFPYGEILVCPAVAEEAALAFGHPVQDEVLLYALHGVLHLAGYDDKEPTAAAEMAHAQEELLQRVLSD
jgi:probable rRNA maturation factor